MSVRLGIGTAGRRLVQVQLAGGTTWALPPSAGKCTQHTAWGKAGKVGKGRTHAHQCQNVSGKLCPLALVRVGPDKQSNALWRAQGMLLLQQVCHPAANAADAAHFNPHGSRAKAPFAVRRAPNASSLLFLL